MKTKTILLLPTKNEEWVLKSTLYIMKNVFDKIIISDQSSTDGTLELISKIENLDIINNPRNFHSNQVRWELLDEARKRYGKFNLIVNIDADEFIPLKNFKNFKNKLHKFEPGIGFSAPWVQLWRSVKQYRSDKGVWNPKTNFKDFMFLDNGKINFTSEHIINDHTSRIPTINLRKIIKLSFPLLHLQFVNWERSQIKQIWYMCTELIEGANAITINSKYRDSRSENDIKLSKVKNKWIDTYNFENLDLEISNANWYLMEIKKMFQDKGIEFFSDLKIWDNDFILKL